MSNSLPDALPRVLLVDDDVLLLDLERTWLSSEAYEVDVALDGQTALDLMDRAPFDIVIADQCMPGLDGMGLLRALRSPGRETLPYFILVTGNLEPNLLQTAFLQGVDDFIQKPMQRVEFVARLRAARRVFDLNRDLERRIDLSFERRLLETGAAEFRELVATLAHDLRTPIGALRATAESLSWCVESLSPDAQRLAARITQISSHMAETIRDVTETFVCDDPDADVWSEFDLVVEVRDACDLLRGAVKPDVEFALPEPGSCPMRGKPQSIRRLCVNLLSNALRATSAGSVRVEVSADPDRQGWATIRVRDTGGGIPEAILPLLGEPMALSSGARRRHFSVHGSGLGLAICRRVVARHGGRILVQTKDGEGTLVEVSLRGDLATGSTEFDFAPMDAVRMP